MQHSRKRRRLSGVSGRPPGRFATSHPRRVYRSFYARDLKKTIYSEICRLYISLWSVRVGNDVVPSAAFSLPSRPPYFTALSAPRIRWEYLFLLQPPPARSPESTDFLSPARESILTRSRPWCFRKLINLREFELSLSLARPWFRADVVGETYILTNFMSGTNSIFASHKGYSVFRLMMIFIRLIWRYGGKCIKGKWGCLWSLSF